MYRYREEFVEVVNAKGESDYLLLLHIEHSKDQVGRTSNDSEKKIMIFIKENGKANRSELETYTQKSRGTVINRINRLIEKNLIQVNGELHNPTRSYELK